MFNQPVIYVCLRACVRVRVRVCVEIITLVRNYVPNISFYVRFEVFTAVTRKNGVLWDVKVCGSCKNRRFG
jgi:hypothetical protein